jgi:hypothetical protein
LFDPSIDRFEVNFSGFAAIFQMAFNFAVYSTVLLCAIRKQEATNSQKSPCPFARKEQGPGIWRLVEGNRQPTAAR